MLDSETVVTHDPEADPPVQASMRDKGCELVLYFDSLAPDAPLRKIEIRPDREPFEPLPFVPQLPLYLNYTRAVLAFDQEDAAAAIRALRNAGSTRRGLSDDFYKVIARSFEAIVAEGTPHPVKALAKQNVVDISTASRWVKRAKQLGYIKEASRGK